MSLHWGERIRRDHNRRRVGARSTSVWGQEVTFTRWGNLRRVKKKRVNRDRGNENFHSNDPGEVLHKSSFSVSRRVTQPKRKMKKPGKNANSIRDQANMRGRKDTPWTEV